MAETTKSTAMRTVAIVAGVLLVAAVAITAAKLLAPQDSPAAQPTDTEYVTAADGSRRLVMSHEAILLPGYSLDELIDRADLIVAGTVNKRADAILIEPSNDSEPRFFTDVTFAVETVFRKPAVSDPDAANTVDEHDGPSTVTVRTAGGMGDLLATVVDETPAFDPSTRWLLFLTRDDGDDPYYVPGDQYYVIGIATGAWPVDSANANTFVAPYEHPDSRTQVTATELENLIAQQPDTAENPRSGEPNGILAADDNTATAHIMTADEQAAYERGQADALGIELGTGTSASSTSS